MENVDPAYGFGAEFRPGEASCAYREGIGLCVTPLKRWIATPSYSQPRQQKCGLFDADKEETRVPIGSLEETYEYTEALRASIKSYL